MFLSTGSNKASSVSLETVAEPSASSPSAGAMTPGRGVRAAWRHLTRGGQLISAIADRLALSGGVAPLLGQMNAAAERMGALRRSVEIAPFMACPLDRSEAESLRVLYVGELSPYSGVADFLSCAIAWAERRPAARLDLCWAGRGDMRGVLQAQLTPPNMTQAFVAPPAGDELARLFTQSGLLVVPSLSDAGQSPVAEAMAAGLPVLGSVRSGLVRLLVRPSSSGWHFDPLYPDQMAACLDAALTTPASRLTEMRIAARDEIAALFATPLDAVQRSRRRRAVDLLAADEPA